MAHEAGVKMLCPGRILLVLGLVAGVAVAGASFGGASPALHSGNIADQRTQLVPVTAKKSPAEKTRARQCKALNKCRWHYAHCEKKVYGGMKPGPRRNAAKEACVDEYRACIKKGFPDGGLLFERWFMPGACT